MTVAAVTIRLVEPVASVTLALLWCCWDTPPNIDVRQGNAMAQGVSKQLKIWQVT
jgi:hypothetical protein